MSHLAIARRCHWRYEWVAELDAEVYEVLLDELMKEQAALERRDRTPM